MNDFEIRKAAIEDLDDILRLNSALFEKEYEEFDTSLDKSWTCSEVGKEYFSGRILNDDGVVLVVEKDEKNIGYLCGGIHPRYCRINAKHAELENMLIKKEYRGLGIGKELGKQFLDWCDQNEVRYITVTASAKNAEGIGYYKSLGFQDYDVTLQIDREEIK